ncbi:MAG: homocysteine S-methyltransferase family protein [Chloroflexi bacterium]|nr:homocysteine S-methyltransferase family protein [Chloroflexota bacterium]MQC27137.1 homocysteine S-methyltransferase family protein [Chloroflexota bacterium]
MSRFVERLSEDRPILLDGATGTELERRGVNTSSPIWSAMALVDAPGIVEQVHRDYLEAGAEVIIANTFRTQRRALTKVGMGDEAARLAGLAVSIARKAVQVSGKEAFVAGSMAPLEDSYTPFEQAYETFLQEHREIANNLAAAGVDLLMIETMNSVREAQAAAQAAQETGLPFGVSFVCGQDGRLLSGESLQEVTDAVSEFKPSFLSINCTPLPAMAKALTALLAATDLPIGAYANAGHSEDFEKWGVAAPPEDYARHAKDWLAMGAKLVGGCCETQPEHIAAIFKPEHVEAIDGKMA